MTDYTMPVLSEQDREELIKFLDFLVSGSSGQHKVIYQIALASLTAEPVAYVTYKGYLLHAADPKLAEYSHPSPLYDAPPVPVKQEGGER